MNELVIQDDFTKQLQETQAIQTTCAKLLQTKHYAKLGEEGVHVILARSKALGIHPFEALNGGFYVVHGKVGMSTEMMAALIRKRGHSISKDPKSTNECVILHGKRADNGDTWTCTFTKEDAIRADLWNTATWKKYPGVMLYNRCMSMLFRQLFPDLSMGAGYVEDELKEITKTGDYQNNLPIADAKFIEPEFNKNKKDIIDKDCKITQDEESLISSRLEQYSDEIVEKAWKWINSKGINTLSDLTKDLYDKLNKKLDETDNSQGI